MKAPSVSAAILSLAALAAAQTVEAESEGAPPAATNVLLIVVDDLNDWIGALGGHPQAVTPNLDRLAARGVSFTNAHAAATVCHPSRTALLTGVAPHRSGLYRNSVPLRDALPDAVTLPQLLRDAGYVTLGAGKVFHDPDPVSWSRYFPAKKKDRVDDPMPADPPLSGLPLRDNLDFGPLDVDDAEMGDAQVVDWAARVLGEERGRPFLLAVGLYRPHLPWYAPRKYFDALPLESIELPRVLADDLEDVPESGRRLASARGDDELLEEHDAARAAVRAYLACIAFLDAQVGRLLDALEAGPHAENTVVLLTSDHGYHLGEKQHWRKSTGWEEATRVPLLVSGPGIERGACAAPVSLLDVYPTVLELCGRSATTALDGESLVPLLGAPSGGRERPALSTFAYRGHSLRDARWRYIRYPDGSEELYDHASDPEEWTNLADSPEHAEAKAAMIRWLPREDAPDVRSAFVGR